MSKGRLLEVERVDDEWVVRVRLKEFHLLPSETKKHVVGAGREALLAVRSILDSAISHAGGEDKKSAPESIAVQ